MQEERYITILSNRRKIVLSVSSVLYVLMIGKKAEIHVSGGKVYETRLGLGQLEEALGEGFLKVHRGCLVSAMAIHDITDTVNLSSGESLEYARRKRGAIIEQFRAIQRSVIRGFSDDGIPGTQAGGALRGSPGDCGLQPGDRYLVKDYLLPYLPGPLRLHSL